MSRLQAAIEEERARQAIRDLGPLATRGDHFRVIRARENYDKARSEDGSTSKGARKGAKGRRRKAG